MARSSFFAALAFMFLTLSSGAFEPASAAPKVAPNPAVIDPSGRVCPGVGYTARVVKCIRVAVDDATKKFFNEFYKFFKNTINIAIVLAVALYGSLLVSGHVESAPRDTFILLFKIGGVLYFTSNFPQIYQMMIDFMTGLLNIVTKATAVSHMLNCPVSNGVTLWNKLDCAVDRVIGIAPGILMKTGIVGLLAALIFSTTYGFVIFLFGVLIILTLLVAVARAVFIYLNAFIALTIMTMIAPLTIPLILFRHTKPMFDKWLKMTIGYVLQPVFLFAYLALMLTALDTTIFSGETSLYRTMAGNEVKSANFSLGNYMNQNNIIVEKPAYFMMLDTNPTDTKGASPDSRRSSVIGDFLDYGKSGAKKIVGGGLGLLKSTTGIGLPDLKVVDFSHWANVVQGKPGQADEATTKLFFKKLFISFLVATLVSYIMYTLLTFIPELGTEIATGAFDGLNLAKMRGMPGEGLIGKVAGLGRGR